MESPSTFVFFFVESPDDAHDLVRCLNPVCPAWTAFEPDTDAAAPSGAARRP